MIVNYISEKAQLGNNSYNAVHVLHKTLEFLNRVNMYIEVAQKANDAKFEEIWNIIKLDRQKHSNMQFRTKTKDHNLNN